MNSLNERAPNGEREIAHERVMVQGTRYAARAVGADRMQVRWELETSRRPGPLTGIAVLFKRLGEWRIDLARETGDDSKELVSAIKSQVLDFAIRLDDWRERSLEGVRCGP